MFINILAKINLDGAKEVYTPISTSQYFSMHDGVSSKMPLNIEVLLVVCSISLSLDLTSHSLSIAWCNLCITQQRFIGLLSSDNYAISNIPFTMVFFWNNTNKLYNVVLLYLSCYISPSQDSLKEKKGLTLWIKKRDKTLIPDT